jgi:hypothetical protein
VAASDALGGTRSSHEMNDSGGSEPLVARFLEGQKKITATPHKDYRGNYDPLTENAADHLARGLFAARKTVSATLGNQ